MRKSIQYAAIALAATSFVALPASFAADPAEARKAIEATNAAISRAVSAGDAAAFASHYTDDAAVLPPGGEIARGRKAIEAFWRATMDGGAKGVELETLEVENLGDTAWELGTVTITMQPEGEDASTAKAKYIVLWKRQPDGVWKLHRDIWNDLPRPAK